jgi:hypothetical protein
VAGEGANRFVLTLMGYLFSLLRLTMYIGFPLAAIGTDLYLSGAFMDGYSAQYGAHGAVTTVLPYIFTLATTGLQVAINDRTKAGFRNSTMFGKCAIVAGWGLIALDTLTDLGGWTAVYSGDVNVGANILPPGWTHDYYWMSTALLVVLICGAQEKILPLLLGRWSLLQGSDDTPGASLVRIGEAAGGFLYSWITNLLKPVGLLAVVALDIVIAPSFIGRGVPTWMAWAISILTTALGWLLWDHAQRVALVRMPDGVLGVKKLSTGAKITMAVAWTFAVGDVILDVAGYTSLVYGDRPGSFLLPPVISWTWIITVTILAFACFAGDVLIKEVLKWPGRADGSSSSTPSPSSGPYDSFFGDDINLDV